MSETLHNLYLPVFFTVLAVVLCLEWLSPWQRREALIAQRWSTNLGLYTASYLVSLLLLPAGILAYSASLPARGLGHPELSLWWSIPATALLLDCWRYWEHRLFHQASILWHLHLVHHSDTRLDVTTTERHHPLEAVVGLLSFLVFIYLLAPPLEGLLVYTLLAVAISLWSHANLELPLGLDQRLRSVLVTPAVHAVHHSDQISETDSNYGTVFTLWDRVFGTYTVPGNERQLRFGLEYFHQANDLSLWRTLLQPLLYHPGMHAPARDDQPRLPIADPADRSRLWRSSIIVVMLCGFALLLAFPDTVQSLTRTWLTMGDWAYALLVIPTFAYLVLVEYREEILAHRPRPSWTGLLPALAGTLLMLGGEILDINVVRQIALVVFLQAVLLATLGVALYSRYLALWWLLFLMVPYGDAATPILRDATLWSVQTFAWLSGHSVQSQGFSLTFAGNPYTIVDACAGLNYFTLAVFLSYSLALVLFRRLLPVLAVTAIAAGVAMLANFVRVNTIIFMDVASSTQASLEGHSPYYWLALGLLFALLFLMLTWLTSNMNAPEQPAPTPVQPAGTTTAWRQAGLATALCLLPALAGHSGDQLLMSPPTFKPPAVLAGYQRLSDPTAWQLRDDGDTVFSTAHYRAGASEMAVVAEFPVYRHAKLDSWRLLPDEFSKWWPERRDLRQACDHCPTYLHHTWVLNESDELYNVYASYINRHALTTSQLRLRVQRGLYRLQGGSEQVFGVIAFVSNDPVRDGATISAILTGLQSALDPTPVPAAASLAAVTQ